MCSSMWSPDAFPCPWSCTVSMNRKQAYIKASVRVVFTGSCGRGAPGARGRRGGARCGARPTPAAAAWTVPGAWRDGATRCATPSCRSTRSRRRPAERLLNDRYRFRAARGARGAGRARARRTVRRRCAACGGAWARRGSAPAPCTRAGTAAWWPARRARPPSPRPAPARRPPPRPPRSPPTPDRTRPHQASLW